MTNIVTLTVSPAIDKSSTVKRVVPDTKLRCGAPRREPGGGGVNVSRALLRLGGDSLAVFLAGGPTGQILEELLEGEGLTCRPLKTEGWTRENLTIREEDEGDHQYRFTMPGPEIREEEWRACLEELAGLDPTPKYLVASGSLPPGVPSDLYARVAGIARDLGSRLILDTSGDALKEGLEEGVFLVKPNLRELGTITGTSASEEESDYEEKQAEAARKLVAKGGAEAVLVSMGSAGALLVTKDETTRISSPTVPIRSKVGAGDSMVAGVVLGLSRDFDLPKAALFGVAAGAAAVMTPGSELCRRRDAEALFRRMVDRN
jgi:6-phosphofructokinase 2